MDRGTFVLPSVRPDCYGRSHRNRLQWWERGIFDMDEYVASARSRWGPRFTANGAPAAVSNIALPHLVPPR